VVLGGEGIALAESEREVMGGPWSESRDGGYGCHQLVEGHAAIEPHGFGRDRLGEDLNRLGSPAGEPNAGQVAVCEVVCRREDVTETELLQPGRRFAVAFSETAGDRGCARDADPSAVRDQDDPGSAMPAPLVEGTGRGDRLIAADRSGSWPARLGGSSETASETRHGRTPSGRRCRALWSRSVNWSNSH
jgi:hypothetical protein